MSHLQRFSRGPEFGSRRPPIISRSAEEIKGSSEREQVSPVFPLVGSPDCPYLMREPQSKQVRRAEDAADHSNLGVLAMARLISSSRSCVVALAFVLFSVPFIA